MLGIFRREKKTNVPCAPRSLVPAGISEPVFSIVGSIRKNPRRWELKQEFDGSLRSCRYTLTDKELGTEFSIRARVGIGIYGDDNVGWMTTVELNYAYEEIAKIFEARRKRYSDLLTLRRQRIARRRRNELIALYTEGLWISKHSYC